VNICSFAFIFIISLLNRGKNCACLLLGTARVRPLNFSIECAQYGVMCSGIRLAVARRHLTETIPCVVFQRRKVVAQQRESPDVPVIFGFRNGRLQQNANRSFHSVVLSSIRPPSRLVSLWLRTAGQ